MAKAKDAFRTISEVSEALDTPAHVLRFWESKFTQIKPVKRAGGRRYYRPDDLSLLSGIKKLLHEQGMTIKGAQKLLREKGVKHVIALGQDATDGSGDVIDMVPTAPETPPTPVLETKAAPVETAAPVADVVDHEAVAAIVADDPTPPQVQTDAQPRLFTAPSANAPADTDVPDAAPVDDAPTDDAADSSAAASEEAEPSFTSDDVPSFLRQQPMVDTPPRDNPPAEPAPAEAQDADSPASEDASPPEVTAPAPIAAALAVPRLSDDLPEASDRIFGLIQQADVDVIAAHSAQIAPLVARLEGLRDQMRRS
ncbi:MerR family transcriptional regulator [Yoonia sp. 208BN28-4]|uniref:MerR family transcriptional regulator n=1 Tax=Yoonia sp. 208BN28-4 TaxID=3126505 RepID=UPI0030A30403